LLLLLLLLLLHDDGTVVCFRNTGGIFAAVTLQPREWIVIALNWRTWRCSSRVMGFHWSN